MRNNIHMNLFASFILRALSILIKDALLEATNIRSQDQEQGFPQASMPPVELLVNNEVSHYLQLNNKLERAVSYSDHLGLYTSY